MYDIGIVYRWTDGHGETSIPLYNFVAGGIKRRDLISRDDFEMVEHYIIGCKEKSILEGFGEGLV